MMMKFELRHIILILILAIMTGCTDTPVPAVAPSPDTAARPLSFTLSSATVEPASRSLVYEGLNTSFTEGTMIGCVIAFKDAEADGGYAYQANSCWTWHPDGLLLHKLYDADNTLVYHAAKPDETTVENTIIRHFTAEELAEQQPDAEPDPHAPYYIKLLNETADYAFFFYYPYVDAEVLTTAYESTLTKDEWGNDIYGIKNVSYPTELQDKYNYNPPKSISVNVINENTLIRQVAKEAATNDNALYCSSWKEYLVATTRDYSIGNNTTDRLNHSDFMYGAVTEMSEGQPLNAENAKSEIPVTLKKQMVTMDLFVLDEIDGSTIKLNPKNVNYNPVMKRIRGFNLASGKFEKEYANNSNGNIIEKNSYFNEYGSPLIPCKIGTVTEIMNGEPTTYHVYRLILPPQSNSEFRCSLSFRAEGHSNELTLNDMHQNSGIKSLQSGYYYKLRFTKLNEDYGFHLDIDDWQKGDEISINRPD